MAAGSAFKAMPSVAPQHGLTQMLLAHGPQKAALAPWGPQQELLMRMKMWKTSWVAVKELKISYQNSETISFAIDHYSGNLNSVP